MFFITFYITKSKYNINLYIAPTFNITTATAPPAKNDSEPRGRWLVLINNYSPI